LWSGFFHTEAIDLGDDWKLMNKGIGKLDNILKRKRGSMDPIIG
jgi:hypothetical protein